MKTGVKRKWQSAFVLQRAVKEAAGTQNSQSGPAKPLPWALWTFNITIKLGQSFELCLWASVLCLHLFCASISKISTEVNASTF